ncbi:MAG: peptide deformylase [Herpetosiphon sp.]
MAVRPTLELGNPALRVAAEKVQDATAVETQSVLTDLQDTLHEWRQRNGWGKAMSGPAIGISQRIFVIDYDDQRYVMINPRFEHWSSEVVDGWESCITFPAIWGSVCRPLSVTVVAIDAQGQPFRMEASGDLARIIQHEIDHLDGLMWLDRDPELPSICTTNEYRRRFKTP